MKNYLYISLILLICISCSKENCGNLQVPIKYNDVPIGFNIAFCMKGNGINHYPIETNQDHILEFARSSDNYFSQEEGRDAPYLTLNSKNEILREEAVFECSSSEPSLEVQFFRRIYEDKGRPRILHSEIPVLDNKFEYIVDSYTLIDSISISVEGLEKPFGIAFYDNSGDIERSFYLIVPRCGVIEYDLFQLHWTSVNFILGYNDDKTKNLFKGTIKGDYLENLFKT